MDSKIRNSLVCLLLILIGCTDTAQNEIRSEPHKEQLRTLFPLEQVRVTDGPFAHAQAVNVQYLLGLDPDRLLAPYLREAGIQPQAEPYGNWENSGLDGHIGGHYLSALSLAWAATGIPELKQRLNTMINGLEKAQNKNGGYLGGIPNGEKAWQEIHDGNIRADLFSLNDRWVPLYNIDKIFHGLRDAYLIGKNTKAREMLLTLSKWMLRLVENLSDEQIQQMLYSEHGGLAEVFVDVARISDDARYLNLARQFSHLKIINPLTLQRDELTGLHANTQIPKIIGALKLAEAQHNSTWQEAADYFWNTVTEHRTVSIGGNSVREHFHDASDFTPMIEDVEGPETCNTYNMLKLSKLLYVKEGDSRYIDFYERATYNHILSSQHPVHGGLVYFTSMRPGHYRKYSSLEESMWCCVGSGIENHSKYGELIYTKYGRDLDVNLYISSTLDWRDQGIKVDMQTLFPDENMVNITFNFTDENTVKPFNLRLRKPAWLTESMSIKVNGQDAEFRVDKHFIVISRQWQNGDNVKIGLSPNLHLEQLPDGKNYYSVLYGPIVLATQIETAEDQPLDYVADNSRMGHVAAGPICPPEALPIMLGQPTAFLESLHRAPGPLSFSIRQNLGWLMPENAINDNRQVTLIPFFRLHDSRYQIYWPNLQKESFAEYELEIKENTSKKLALEAITVDLINPGEQQPEVEHNFAGQDTRAGINNGHRWRDAVGWFGYYLNNTRKQAQSLRITYFKGDIDREFLISINDVILADVRLPAASPNEAFYQVDYPLSKEMRQAKLLKLRFTAKRGSVAGGVYGIRLLKGD
ncbi:hypothetical protein P886_3650 [Alteromonadaceae bacterium 2753L.S.0a.02]|nr:hypothetical protein P886_3650 [Alteromonadaceae bacterium 2753L.S.0a.02]